MLRSNYQSNLTRKERFIFLYGEKQGLERYFDVCKKKVSSAFLVSKAEVNALSQIIDILHLNAELIFWNNHQYFCRTLGGIKFLDFYDKQNNIWIEFNGDYFHANPEIYSVKSIIRNSKGERKCAFEIWDKEYQSIKSISQILGCMPYIIWEHNWNIKKEEEIAKIKQLYGGGSSNENN